MDRNHQKGKINSLDAIIDLKCKANSIRLINRKVCRNNCNQWKNNKCLRGH